SPPILLPSRLSNEDFSEKSAPSRYSEPKQRLFQRTVSMIWTRHSWLPRQILMILLTTLILRIFFQPLVGCIITVSPLTDSPAIYWKLNCARNRFTSCAAGIAWTGWQ